MNEQLVVKNFGPIQDATVDFKRVTVFIGPTGGGKSTLAKLAAIFRDVNYSFWEQKQVNQKRLMLSEFNLRSFVRPNSKVRVYDGKQVKSFDFDKDEIFVLLGTEADEAIQNNLAEGNKLADEGTKLLKHALSIVDESPSKAAVLIAEAKELLNKVTLLHQASRGLTKELGFKVKPNYVLSERTFVPAIEYSWAGLMRDDIGLPKLLLEFANNFSLSRKEVSELDIPFLNVKYIHIDGRDFIKIPEREEPLMLLETASGIQSVTPLLVLLEHLSRNTEQAQSFIIEEPELNLYPTAQRDLVYTLLEKCTQGENDLTITTHSPYVLTALNVALYANKVATQFPHQSKKVAKLIPEKYWLNANEFSAYFVAGGGVKSIFNQKTGLLDESQLDDVSGDFADIFDRLTDLRVPEKKAPAKAKPAKK